jgi:nucleotide-binding universal stress UspA family protein
MMTGSVGNRLAEMGRQVGADLIVVGTRGHSGVSGALLGSASHKLLSHAHVPVMVVPDAEQASASGGIEAEAGASG